MTPRCLSYARIAAEKHGVTVEDVLGRSTRKPIAKARREVMNLLRLDGFTTTQIGRWLDRDHSSVCHATKKLVENLSAPLT